jgi:chitinase
MMKHITLAMLVAVTVFACKSKQKPVTNEAEPVVLGYVTSWTQPLPDPNLLTHINYAFGHVNDTFDGVNISNEERLHTVVALKEQNPDLKILLSVGGWGSGNFSEMAADDALRASFAADCARVVDEFSLGGIDIDWEYPTSDAAGISSSPADKDNFTLLMRDIRQAIGKDKLLTLATSANGKYYDFRAIDPYVDFVNIMAYDMDNSGSKHHSGLYRSDRSPNITTHEAVEAHLAGGVPAHKLVMGVPFYGRASSELNGFTDYKELMALEGYQRQWDDVAKAPYLVDSLGNMVAGYDDPESLGIKMEYIREHGLRGVMYWDFNGDTEDLTLSKVIYYGLYPERQ